MAEIRGLRGLRHHDPDGANFALAVLRLLGEQSAEGAGIKATVSDALPLNIPVFQAADGVAFCITNLEGLSRFANPSDIDAACDVLDIADTVLTHIERALSISLAPVDLAPADGRSGSATLFEVFDCETKVAIAVPHGHPNAAIWIAAADGLPVSLIDMPLLVQLSLSGPRLPMAEASAIAGGDLLLLPGQTPASLHICTPDNAPELIAGGAGLFDLRNGDFCIGEPHNHDIIGEDMHADDEFTNAKQFGALQVPVTIRLPEKLVQAADIAALKPGGTLHLGAMVHGLVAELVIGGKILAKGEIVQMGDDFALLIEERNPIATHMRDPDLADTGPTADDAIDPETGEE